MVQVHYPPVTPFSEGDKLKIFLAGTIDMGNSTDWQQMIIDHLNDNVGECPVEVFNPRRKDWDSSWEQSKSHPMFKRQVEWELTYQEKADVILMVFLPKSHSPISMLELGTFRHKPMLVYNPEDFYRHGNIDIFCSRYSIPTLSDWDDYMIAVKRFINQHIIKLAKHA